MKQIIVPALLGLAVIVESMGAATYWPSRFALLAGIAALLTWIYMIYQVVIEVRNQPKNEKSI